MSDPMLTSFGVAFNSGEPKPAERRITYDSSALSGFDSDVFQNPNFIKVFTEEANRYIDEQDAKATRQAVNQKLDELAEACKVEVAAARAANLTEKVFDIQAHYAALARTVQNSTKVEAENVDVSAALVKAAERLQAEKAGDIESRLVAAYNAEVTEAKQRSPLGVSIDPEELYRILQKYRRLGMRGGL